MRRLLFIALLLTASPSWAATRFYLPFDGVPSITPNVDAGWEESNQFLRRNLLSTKGSESISTIGTIDITEDQANWQEVHRQFISAGMSGGVVFTSGVTTVSSQIMMREFAATDDVDKCILGIRVLTNDGTAVQATLLAVANYGPTLEFISNATLRNKTCADGDTITASYTTVDGDRLVVEVGYQTDGAETTPQATMKLGQTGTDLPVDETQTSDGVPWIEFSNTITFPVTVIPIRPPVVFQ